MKVAIYYRVSTDSQADNATIEAQRQILPPYATAQSWEIVDTYEDEGFSGAYMEGREDFRRLLNDMAQRKFDILLVSEHSRVTRTENLAEMGQFIQSMVENDIKLASPHEGLLDLSAFHGRFMAMAKSMFAGEERAEIARRMKRGKARKMANGEYPQPSVPYGLKRFKDHTIKPPKNVVDFDETEYANMRLVYDLVVNEGYSLTKVCDHLNELGKKSRKGRKWQPSWLCQMLLNESSVTGTIYAHRYDSFPTGRFNAKGKMIYGRKEKPRDQWIAIKVPAIFTKAEYKQLRHAIDKNRRQQIVGRYGDERFLLRGRLKCGICGRNYETVATKVKGKRYDYYQCTGWTRKKYLQDGETPCTHSPKINARALDHQIIQSAFLDLVENPEGTIKKWQASTKGKVGEGNIKKLKRRIEYVNSELENENRKLAKLLDQELVGEYPRHILEDRARTINKAIKILTEQKVDREMELQQAEQLRNSLKVVRTYEEEWKRFDVTIAKKFKTMAMVDKQELLGYFMPAGSYIEILPLAEGHPIYARVPGSKIRAKQTWQYKFVGAIDMVAFLEALNEWDRTGTIPEPSVFVGESMTTSAI